MINLEKFLKKKIPFFVRVPYMHIIYTCVHPLEMSRGSFGSEWENGDKKTFAVNISHMHKIVSIDPFSVYYIIIYRTTCSS